MFFMKNLCRLRRMTDKFVNLLFNIEKEVLNMKNKLLMMLYTLVLGVATLAANSPSCMNKYQPECPKKLKK